MSYTYDLMAKKIVVVDDDPDILDALQMAIEEEGYEVKTTTRGAEADKLAETYRPDLIILDILLSGMDGREIAKKLKSKKSTGAIPILMISASPHAGETVHFFGADAFLAKPFDLDVFIKRIQSLLN